MSLYILDDQKNVIPIDITQDAQRREYVRFMDKLGNRIVKRDELTCIDGEILLSTVFLGCDMGYEKPQYFETMLFKEDNPGYDLICYRYACYADAVQGHRNILELLEACKSIEEINALIYSIEDVFR